MHFYLTIANFALYIDSLFPIYKWEFYSYLTKCSFETVEFQWLDIKLLKLERLDLILVIIFITVLSEVCHIIFIAKFIVCSVEEN